MATRHEFTDPVSGQQVTLVVGPRVPYPGWIGEYVGVEHDGCPHLADVTVELDAYYCTSCRANGRVSGAWVVDMVKAAP